MLFSSSKRAPVLAAALAVGALACPGMAEAYSPFLVVPDPAVAEASPAYRYANMTDAEAFAEVDRRHILYTRLGAVSGVRAPIRLTGRLHGVYIHSSLPPDQRVTSPFEILDARLALALDDFAAILERHDIDEVVHFTMYRPNVAGPDHGGADDLPDAAHAHALHKGPSARLEPARHGSGRASAKPAASPKLTTAKAQSSKAVPPSSGHGVKQKTAPPGAKVPETVNAPAPKTASKSAAHGAAASKQAPAVKPLHPAAAPHVDDSALHKTTWAPPGTRHPAGLAIDVGLLHKKSGSWLSVANHFHGHIGDRTCGEGAHVPEEPEARELRALVCESSDLGVFTYVLTPDYNAAHVDHFHMEIKPGVRWFLYH